MKKKLFITTGVLMALTVSLLAWTRQANQNMQIPLTMNNIEALALTGDGDMWEVWQQGMRGGSIELYQRGPDGKWHKVTIYCCVDATEYDACNAPTNC